MATGLFDISVAHMWSRCCTWSYTMAHFRHSRLCSRKRRREGGGEEGSRSKQARVEEGRGMEGDSREVEMSDLQELVEEQASYEELYRQYMLQRAPLD